MPETPELQQEEAQFTVADVPMREGEKERFGANLNLEDGRRREARATELREELRQIAGTSAGEVASRFARSPSARKRQQLVLHKTQELKNLTNRHGDVWEGPCAPATIINLNPIALKLYGQLQRLTIPPAGKGVKIGFIFRGRAFTGSYVTLSTPEVWLAITGTTNDPMGDTPTMEAKYISPLGLAHQFYSHYCEGASDAQHMGGIIVFEGDIHVLDKPKLERANRTIKVPQATFSNDGTGEVLYSVVPVALDEYLERELAQQRSYAGAMIAEGHRYANSQSDDVRNQLSNFHVLWHNYALERGYIDRPLPWASEKLRDHPSIQAIFCPDCRTRQADPEQYFCANCNAPFDACKAFLAGKMVTPDRLAVYDENSEEFRAIRAEMVRRRNRKALLELPDDEEPKKTKART